MVTIDSGPFTLTCHPETPAQSIREIDVVVKKANSGSLMLTYRLAGDVSALSIPETRSPRRAGQTPSASCPPWRTSFRGTARPSPPGRAPRTPGAGRRRASVAENCEKRPSPSALFLSNRSGQEPHLLPDRTPMYPTGFIQARIQAIIPDDCTPGERKVL